MQERQNDPAVQYARARVEEIRKRLGHYSNDTTNENSQGSSKVTENSGTRIEFYSRVQKQNEHGKIKKVERNALEPSIEFAQYENRIKNIDKINDRIKSVLKQQSRPKPQPYTRQASKQNQTSHKSQRKQLENTSPTKKYQRGVIADSEAKRRSKLSDFGNGGYSVSIEINTKEKQNIKRSIVETPIDKTYSNKKIYEEKISNMKSYKKEYEEAKMDNIKGYLKKMEEIKTGNNQENLPLSKRNDKPRQSFTRSSNSKVGGVPQKLQTQTKNKEKLQIQPTQSEKEQGGRKQTIKLAEKLGDQIKVDQALRQAKWEFSEFIFDHKWDLLMEECISKGIKITNKDELVSKFSLCTEQNNPFFQASSPINKTCIQKLIQAYLEAEKFWANQMAECVSIRKLEAENFEINDIDTAKKGYISLEDLVCFINLYTGNFFRNRDVFSLHRRFNKCEDKTQLKYEQFLDKVTARG